MFQQPVNYFSHDLIAQMSIRPPKIQGSSPLKSHSVIATIKKPMPTFLLRALASGVMYFQRGISAIAEFRS